MWASIKAILHAFYGDSVMQNDFVTNKGRSLGRNTAVHWGYKHIFQFYGVAVADSLFARTVCIEPKSISLPILQLIGLTRVVGGIARRLWTRILFYNYGMGYGEDKIRLK